MAKNNRNKSGHAGKQTDKSEQKHSYKSDKKTKHDGKPKKAKEADHLQHIPFRLREIMKSKDQMKAGTLRSKKVKKGESKPSDSGVRGFGLKEKRAESADAVDVVDGVDIPVPHFKRGRKESVKSYLRRMEVETKHVLFLTNNQVERKPELDQDQQENPAKGKSDKKKEFDQMKLQRLHQKKLKRQEAAMEKEMFVDHVPFGDVSMAPPALSVKPRKAAEKTQNSTRQLLLNSLLGVSAVKSSAVKPSMARQRMMEEERERAVKAYRLLKKQKLQQQKKKKKSRTVSDE